MARGCVLGGSQKKLCGDAHGGMENVTREAKQVIELRAMRAAHATNTLQLNFYSYI